MSDTSSPPRTSFSNRPLGERLASREVLRTISSRVWDRLGQHELPVQDREDISQNILLAWVESLPRLDSSVGTPDQWLHGIILNHIRRYRGRRREALLLDEEHEEDGEELVDETQHTEEWFMSKQRVQLAQQLFQQIPVDHLDAVLAHELDGLPFEQIAQAYGRSTSTVYRYYLAGMRELREAFEQWKAQQRNEGALLLPITLESLFDAVRSTPGEQPTAEQVERILRRVDEALGNAGPSSNTAPPRPRHPPRLHGWTSTLPVVGYLLAGQPGSDAGTAAVDPLALAPARILRDEIPAATYTMAPPASGLLSSPSPALPVTTTAAATGAQSVDAALDHAAFVAEQIAFDIASEAFAQKNMAAAIKALGQHAQKFPWSPRALERERMWMDALVALGRTAEACQRAESFRHASPKSPLSAQIEALCPGRR
jgi:RNA polymerase sigma factor (sigma-70 family)